MKKSKKALLLSILVYPGAGHFLLKSHFVGMVIIASFSLTLYFFIGDIVTHTNQILEQVTNGVIPLNITAISEAVSQQSKISDEQGGNLTSLFLVALWFFSIVDVYRIGRKNNEKS